MQKPRVTLTFQLVAPPIYREEEDQERAAYYTKKKQPKSKRNLSHSELSSSSDKRNPAKAIREMDPRNTIRIVSSNST